MMMKLLLPVILIVFILLQDAESHKPALSRRNDFNFLGTFNKPIKSSKEFFSPTNYYASQTSSIWVSGLQDCAAIFGGNASLISIETEEEHEWVNQYLTQRGVRAGSFWTSGVYDLSQSKWRWSANPDYDFDTFTAWGVGEPKSLNSKQRVIMNFLNSVSHWESVDDTILNRMICEVPVTEDIPEEGELTLCWESQAIAIVVDSSSSVTEENYALILNFTSVLSSAFTHPDIVGKRYGLMSFSLFPSLLVHVAESLHGDVISRTILSAPYQNYDVRNTHDAIRSAMLQLVEYSNGLPMSIVVITHGTSERPFLTSEIALEAASNQIRMFAIGVDFPEPGNELKNIAAGDEQRVYEVGWESMNEIVGRLGAELCLEDWE